jgi:hypothetical protein
MNTSSILIGTVCLYLIMGMAGCASPIKTERNDNWLREKLKDEVCDEPEVLIIIEQGSCEVSHAA